MSVIDDVPARFIARSLAMSKPPCATPEQIAAARRLHECDEVEIDNVAATSPTDEGGTWIQAWVWLPDECLEQYKQEVASRAAEDFEKEKG
jgi:hypothetical protein